ncbi:MAG: EamA family transporter [Myxococcota bacterium]
MSTTVLALVLLSALLHAAWSASIKSATSPLVFNVMQTAVAVPVCLLGLTFFDFGNLSETALAWLAGTALAHALYYYWLSRALERADLTLAYPIVRSTPALLPLLAVPVLGEVPSPLGALGIAVVVAGVWAVYGGGFSRAELTSPRLRFAWLTLGTTVAYSLTDKAGMAALEDVAWQGALPASLAWFCLLSLCCTPLFLALAARHVPLRELRLAVRRDLGRAAVAFAGSLAGYGLILEAYRTAPASYVVAVRQTSVLFAAVIAIVFLREQPSRGRLLGAAATVAGVALIGWAG